MGILGKAIKAQQEGATYYSRLAQRSAQSALSDIFAMLADDEKRHEMILQAAREKVPAPLREDGIGDKVQVLFQSIEELKSEIPAPLEQAEVYLAALDMERQAVQIYEELLESSPNPEDKALYAFLIDQEQIHIDLLEALYQHINRPNNWVEAAEFGIREEY